MAEKYNGKRKFEEGFGDDDISDELVTMIGKHYDDIDAPDNVLDEELIEIGEEINHQQSPLFQFEFQPIGNPKKSLKIGTQAARSSPKKQLRPATKQDDIGREITRGVADMARRVIEKSQPTELWKGKQLKEDDRVMFHFTPKKFTHPLQSSKFTVAEILNGTPRFETSIQTLANQLNPKESFDANDEFQVDMTIITVPETGGKAKSVLGKLKIASVLRDKRCVLPIENNEDDLCLARAICLTKAHIQKDEDREGMRNYWNLKRSANVLTRAGVPEGPCGREELKKFQEYLAPDYQLKVMSVNYPYCITFEGNVNSSKIIRLPFESDLEGDIGHYHGCSSYMGFLERSYYCDDCNRGFDHDDFMHHPCEGHRCKAGKTIEYGPRSHQPSLLCRRCSRHFYDDRCLALHHK
ncbi:hypothetical protein AWC38_SpisGene21833 [Stylophora pistillata]|uniref:C2H2-type domain-containing protein n=1 Tax=Stylophora pistillata TaxID=50429 RepID=A0A2B4RCR3_STYPI|nr:hypothetical protein AWC38_SpisGene21833 [Stylophora pistillata]